MIKLWKIVSAILVRLFLIIHCLLAVWRAADVEKNNLFWLLGLSNILIVIEGTFRVIKKDGDESKWFTPCILFYLMGIVPAIWILEIDRLDRFTALSDHSNVTNAQSEALSTIEGVTLPLKLDADTWVSVLEQSMLFFFVVARWILPRGLITRDQLSQLLFVYIGTASDVMELFVVFEEPEIRSDLVLSYFTLGVWTLSLIQFCLVLTSTRDLSGKVFSRETDFKGDIPEDTPKDLEKERMPGCCERIFELEIWSLCIAILLQDGPFLVLRLYSMFVKGVISYGIMFFTAKNILIISMQVYRIIVICLSFHNVDNEELNAARGFHLQKTASTTSVLTNIASNSTMSSILDE